MKNITKNMKKFLLKNIFFSFVLVGGLYLLSLFYLNFICDTSVKFMELNKIPEKSFNIVNTGSSHGCYGIKYPEDVKGFNLALSSQKFYYDYEVLKKYSDKLNDGCIVVLPVSIFSFYNGYDVEYISRNYIPFIDKDKIIGVDEKEYYLVKYFSITQPMRRLVVDCGKYILKIFKNKKIEKNYVVYSPNLSFEEKKQAAVETALSHLGITDKNSSHDKNIGISQLKEMILFLKENNFIPVLITTPQSYLYNEQIRDENYQERIYDNILEVEKILGEKFLYLDYSHDERFSHNLEYFSDDDHLNEKGAEYFTKILLKDIKEKGYNF